ncbi:MAG: hypothetical protein Q8N18_10395 [Opitutaceae bacterium]|nr:hypothetical protein [Opitutaceae bacterium]
MKRSRIVTRVLLGGVSVGAFSACGVQLPRGSGVAAISAEAYYANDHFIPGAGYYHAPFRGFFPLAYNHYDAARKMYFHGGQWSATPHRSIVNLSTPTPEAAIAAQGMRTDISRGGFGGTSRSHFLHS